MDAHRNQTKDFEKAEIEQKQAKKKLRNQENL